MEEHFSTRGATRGAPWERRPTDVSELSCFRLPRTPACAGRARRLLEREVGASVDRRLLDDARTVLSELVNNAYVHGSGDIELRLGLRDQRLRVEVIDQGQGAAVAVRRSGNAGGGHGLRIVGALASQWGAFEGTTHVWAELDVAPE